MPHSRQTHNSRFISLGQPRRIWAVSAIHSEIDRLARLHDDLYRRIEPGDRVVYLGNYSGFGPAPCETIDEILTFRRMVLARPGMMADDIVFLRGGQEEMWQNLMQLHFAPDPQNVLLWMLGNGLAKTLEAYGHCPHEGIDAARKGTIALTRWTQAIRDSVRCHAGHDMFYTHIHRAAFTPQDCATPLLFVHAGLDPDKSLDQQGDHLWWSRTDFNKIEDPYSPFSRVIRGYDPRHAGVHINCVTATIDGGCGFGGSLIAASFRPSGDVLDIVEA